MGEKGNSKGEVASVSMIMNLNLQLTGVVRRGQLQEETEIWVMGGTQGSMWVCLAVTHMPWRYGAWGGCLFWLGRNLSGAIVTSTHPQNFHPKPFVSTRDAGTVDGVESEGMANQ